MRRKDGLSRTLLMVSYEFPPVGGPGVQRVAKLAKYLPQHGWRPVVLTARAPKTRPLDESLLPDVAGVEVHVTAGVELASVVSRALHPLAGWRRRVPARPPADAGPATAPPLSTRLASWISVPDDRMAWRWIASGAAARLAEAVGADAVFSSAPPYTAHLVAMRAARGRPWVADFRDPWSASGHRFRPTAWHRARDVAWERRVVETAELITCISEPIAYSLVGTPKRPPVFLPNGFDPEDLPKRRPASGPPLRMVYTGTFYGDRSPLPFLDALASLIARQPRLRQRIAVELVGATSERFSGSVAARGLEGVVTLTGYRRHDEALAALATADVALLFIAPGAKSKATFTGKLFEYLGMRMPILAMAPPGVAADLIAEARAGVVVPPDDAATIAAAIKRLVDEKGDGTLPAAVDEVQVARFDRRKQAEQLARLLDDLLS